MKSAVQRAKISLSSQTQLSEIRAGIQYLAQTQDQEGYWTDFWLTQGTSDAWVTAYTGRLMWESAEYLDELSANIARNCAGRAVDWLLKQDRLSGGWGYNGTVAADADSTAWVVMLLAALDRDIPSDSLEFLEQHQVGQGLFRTYLFSADHAWSQACVDVSLTAAMALITSRKWSLSQGRAYWEKVIAPLQNFDGTFTGYWWVHHHFPTFLARRLWQQLGCPVLRYEWPKLKSSAPFLSACAGEIPGQQLIDGSYPAIHILRVPPVHDENAQLRPELGKDSRRIFTTTTVVRFLAALRASVKSFIPARVKSRSGYGVQCDSLVRQASHACGFNKKQQDDAVELFRTMTKRSLSEPNAWPSKQLSSLSLGQPLEFSISTSGSDLRYACEVSDPVLPATARVCTGMAAIAEVAEKIGCSSLWQDLSMVWQEIGRSETHIPAGTRFWVWGGISQPAEGHTTLKIYTSTFAAETGYGRERLERIMAAACLDNKGQVKWLCEQLDKVGFPQEIGFGLRGDGRWGAKIYYEFHGWRPDLITELADALGFPSNTKEILTPTIPGVLAETLARKRRSGLSFRLHPENESVLDLTTTASFPIQLIKPALTSDRIGDWLDEFNQVEAFKSYVDAIAPVVKSPWQLFSIFTKTVTREGEKKVAVYLRPILC